METEDKELLCKILPLLIIIGGSKVLNYHPDYILEKLKPITLHKLDSNNKIDLYRYLQEHKFMDIEPFKSFYESVTYGNLKTYSDNIDEIIKIEKDKLNES
jgi:hypothetical protein